MTGQRGGGAGPRPPEGRANRAEWPCAPSAAHELTGRALCAAPPGSGTPGAQGLGSCMSSSGPLAEDQVPFPRGAPEPGHGGRTHIPRWPDHSARPCGLWSVGLRIPLVPNIWQQSPGCVPPRRLALRGTDRGSMLCFGPRERGNNGGRVTDWMCTGSEKQQREMEAPLRYLLRSTCPFLPKAWSSG